MHPNTGTPMHLSGQATTDAERVVVKNRQDRAVFARSIRVNCVDETNSLDISFDDGTNFFRVGPDDPPLAIDAVFTSFVVKSSAGTADWVAIVVVAS